MHADASFLDVKYSAFGEVTSGMDVVDTIKKGDVSDTGTAALRIVGVEDKAPSPQSVNLIVKRRCVLTGFDPAEFSARGLRSGHMTEAARAGVALP